MLAMIEIIDLYDRYSEAMAELDNASAKLRALIDTANGYNVYLAGIEQNVRFYLEKINKYYEQIKAAEDEMDEKYRVN